MISLTGLAKRASRLFEMADVIQDEWLHNNNMPDRNRKLNKMNRLYAEASAISITLEAAEAASGVKL